MSKALHQVALLGVSVEFSKLFFDACLPNLTQSLFPRHLTLLKKRRREGAYRHSSNLNSTNSRIVVVMFYSHESELINLHSH